MGECPLMTQSGHRAFVLRVICRLRIPLRFAHARDGDPLEYAGFCEKVASRKGFSLRTRLHVDDEQATSRCLVVVCQRPRERELTFVVQGSRGATECAGCGVGRYRLCQSSKWPTALRPPALDCRNTINFDIEWAWP